MKKVINIILMVLWMIFIFVMSSFDASKSSEQSNIIVDIVSNIFNISNLNILTIIVRKLGHFIEYFILGIFTYNVVHNYNKNILIAIIICVLYAVSDEFHQLFVSGRSCQLLDILIDSIGAIVAIYLFSKLVRFNNPLTISSDN